MNFKLALPLMAVMALTRSHHFGDMFFLPDASLAVFFLAGLLQTSRWSVFVTLLAEAVLIDYIAITHFNVSSFCVSPAYIFLVPAYGVMWFGGSYCSKFIDLKMNEMGISTGILALAASGSFLISNGSFYLLSGRYTDLSWAQYIDRVMQYYPPHTATTLCYGVLGLIIIKLFKAIPALTQHKAV
ncbi:hypothetical protein DOJK_02360 [Patescibacteria group bacterium]|nr:hypothetical protein DOJK_02360 [Patescibacteria group bacterium]